MLIWGGQIPPISVDPAGIKCTPHENHSQNIKEVKTQVDNNLEGEKSSSIRIKKKTRFHVSFIEHKHLLCKKPKSLKIWREVAYGDSSRNSSSFNKRRVENSRTRTTKRESSQYKKLRVH